MAQDTHVTSKAIRQLGKDLVEDVAPAFHPVADAISHAQIEQPGFGILGFALQAAYESAQGYAADYLAAGSRQLSAFQTALGSVADTWDRAEDTNQVMFR